MRGGAADRAQPGWIPPGIQPSRVQRRTLAVLFAAQVAGAVGVSAAVAVGALVASRVLGREDLAGLVQSAQVLGAAVLALPAARLASTRGRRAGLSLGLSFGLVGALLSVVAVESGQFWLLLLAVAALGGGSTAGLQARFAATDLSRPRARARSLAMIVWASTIGAVLGPNVVGPTARLATAVGLEPLAGPYLLGVAAMALALAVIVLGLRPDPWLLAQALSEGSGADSRTGHRAAAHPPPARGGLRRRGHPDSPGPLRDGARAASRSPSARLALGVLAWAHTVMVSVMVMTPIHMDHGDASLNVIGFVISVHVAGMFAFAPAMGWLSDVFGRFPVVVGGVATLAMAGLLAARSPQGASFGLTAGLFLLGLGWSACLVAGSTLLTEGVAEADRPVVQGLSDVAMGFAAAGGGAASGLVVAWLGYPALTAGAAATCAAAVVWLLARGRRSVPADPGPRIDASSTG